MVNVFAVPVFFICFRECLETSIIVSVLLSFIKQTLDQRGDAVVQRKLVRQVWSGVGLGLVVCVLIGAGIIGAFYGLGKDRWAKYQDIWEGVFGLLAAVIISVMGAALLRVSKLQDKWRVKISKALEAKSVRNESTSRGRVKIWSEKYAMFFLPFVTVLREGLEAVIFIGGVGLGSPASAFPLAVACGLGAGGLVGWLLYKYVGVIVYHLTTKQKSRGGNRASMQVFLVVSTCFLYLVAAGLFSKAVWSFEMSSWSKLIGGDAAEVGSGPGSYDIRRSVWHVNCCNPEVHGGGGWGIFNAILGWQNSATYGSVISYNVYWMVVLVSFITIGIREKHGALPTQRLGSGANCTDSLNRLPSDKEVSSSIAVVELDHSPK